jgi:hypothetical protein
MQILRTLSVMLISAVVLLNACGPAESGDRSTSSGGAEIAVMPPSRTFIDITPLAGASSTVVDSILGEPSSITPITNEPAEMPGEYRDYAVPGGTDPVTIRFHRDGAVFFTIYLPFPAARPEDALQAVGLNVQNLTHQQTAPAAKWWSGGPFTRVGAITFTNGYNMVQAEVR